MAHQVITSGLSRAFAAVVLTACVGCIPYYGLGQRKVPKDPVAFTDAKTGIAISALLVIPRYSSRSGISSGGGHGPGSTINSSVFIAHPFVYHQGQRFAPRQLGGRGVIFVWPEAFAGSGTMLDGVLVAAPGYKSQWVWDLWSRDGKAKTLTPLSALDSRADLQSLSAMIDQERLSGAHKDLFSYVGHDPVYVRLSDEEKQMVRSFIAKGIEELSMQP